MNLGELLESALKTDSFRGECYDDIASILKDLTSMCHGEEDKVGYYCNIEKSLVPFDMNRDVKGSFVVFDTCPHYPSIKISNFRKITDVENYLTSKCSLLNPFTGFSLVLNKGQEMIYEIWYLNGGNEEKKFIKQHQTFDSEYPSAWVKWKTIQQG